MSSFVEKSEEMSAKSKRRAWRCKEFFERIASFFFFFSPSLTVAYPSER